MIVQNDLYHYGVKGMKWGVRRYQNKDGSLTPAGQKRYDNEQLASKRKKAKEKGNQVPADPQAWRRDDLERQRNVLNASSDLTRNARNLNRATTSRNRDRMDLSSMSDKEMREKINRELLERQYNDVFNPQQTSRGREFLDRTLEIGGATLAVGASALSIAVAVQQLKNGG